MTTLAAPPIEGRPQRASAWPSGCFLRHCPGQPAPPLPRSNYQERLATFERWLDGRRPCSLRRDRRRPSQPLNASLYQALRPGTIDRFVEAMRVMTYANALTATPAKPLSAATIRKNVAAVKTFATWCAADGHLDLNQLAGYRLPPAPEPEIQPFSDPQVVALVAPPRPPGPAAAGATSPSPCCCSTPASAPASCCGSPPTTSTSTPAGCASGARGARQRRVAIAAPPRPPRALAAYRAWSAAAPVPSSSRAKRAGR